MSKLIIEPNSERAKIEYHRLKEVFYEALENISRYGEFDPIAMGLDWNRSRITSKGKGLEFTLADEALGENVIKGTIRDVGRNTPKVTIFNGNGVVGGSAMTRDYIISSLSESLRIAKKLEIQEGVEFLPSGHLPEVIVGGEGNGSSGPSSEELLRYRAFAAELVESGKNVIVGRVNQQFGDYIVVETQKGWFVAFNRNYGEAPYIVDRLDTLRQDKRTIMGHKDAIRIRRDPRGNWIERLRDYL